MLTGLELEQRPLDPDLLACVPNTRWGCNGCGLLRWCSKVTGAPKVRPMA